MPQLDLTKLVNDYSKSMAKIYQYFNADHPDYYCYIEDDRDKIWQSIERGVIISGQVYDIFYKFKSICGNFTGVIRFDSDDQTSYFTILTNLNEKVHQNESN